MSQISMPVRILLAGAVVFLAAYFTVLRPKPATVEPATAVATPVATGTPTDALGRAVAGARHAAGKVEGKTETGSAAQPATAPATKAAAPAVAIPAKALAELPKDVARALTGRKTIVLGVIADDAKSWRPLGDDDRYVRNALRRVNRYDGQVLVKTVPVGRLSTYAPIVGDLHVNQTPSVVVVDGALQARVLAGYVDRTAINQAIADARRDSIHPLITDRYLRTLNTYCAQYITSIDRWSLPTISGKKALDASMNRRLSLAKRYHADLSRIKAPAKWRGLKAQFSKVLGNVDTTLAKQTRAVKQHDLTAFVAAYQAYDFQSDSKLDKHFDQLGVTSCVFDRRS